MGENGVHGPYALCVGVGGGVHTQSSTVATYAKQHKHKWYHIRKEYIRKAYITRYKKGRGLPRPILAPSYTLLRLAGDRGFGVDCATQEVAVDHAPHTCTLGDGCTCAGEKVLADFFQVFNARGQAH